MQASCPLMAAMWAAVQPLMVARERSAPCQRSQWRHYVKKIPMLTMLADIFNIFISLKLVYHHEILQPEKHHKWMRGPGIRKTKAQAQWYGNPHLALLLGKQYGVVGAMANWRPHSLSIRWNTTQFQPVFAVSEMLVHILHLTNTLQAKQNTSVVKFTQQLPIYNLCHRSLNGSRNLCIREDTVILMILSKKISGILNKVRE